MIVKISVGRSIDVDDRDDCEELPVEQIDRLADLHETLEDPDDDDLEEIDLEDFDVYLNVSIEAFEDLVRKYNSREAKSFLYWMVDR